MLQNAVFWMFLLIFCFSLLKYTYYYNYRSHISLQVAKLPKSAGVQILIFPTVCDKFPFCAIIYTVNSESVVLPSLFDISFASMWCPLFFLNFGFSFLLIYSLFVSTHFGYVTCPSTIVAFLI